jgi:two-component system LytT family response regulator
MTSPRVRVLVVEDEPVARETLCHLLEDIDWIEPVGVAADGREALRLIDSLEPDLVFLDVQLPELSGLGVLEEAHHRPAIIFTTAHDRYAVTAFEVQAIDYLLKPFGKRRLLDALERVRARLPAPSPRRPAEPAAGAPVLRLARTAQGKLLPIRLDRATRFVAAGDYVEAHVGGAQHLLRLSLGELEQRLEGDKFWRIHRSHLVAVEAVAMVREHDDERRLVVVLRDGTEIVASRTASRRLRDLIS